MLTVLCVLKSGGGYDAEWVAKLQRAVERHLSTPHVFKCLSDVEVPCERIALKHDWKGWFSKVELFRPGVIDGPTLTLDLDSVIVDGFDQIADLPYDFAMLRNLNDPSKASSAVMWFRKAPHHVYEAFAENPEHYMGEYAKSNGGVYIGDQAWIFDAMDRKVTYFSDEYPRLIRSYRRHCQNGVPPGCSIVQFGGSLKPSNVKDQWVKEAWV
jgi:hypothetical protein